MFSKLKILTGILLLISVLFFLVVQPVFAQPNSNPLNAACQGLQASSPACQQAANQRTTDPIAGPDGIISKAASILALIAGIAAVVMIIIGAFFYITSGGDAQKAATARSRILSGVIGLVVIALAWAIIGIVTGTILQT